MSYTIESREGFIENTYKLHTCESEVVMIVYVVQYHCGPQLGIVHGVYSTERKAKAAKEELSRNGDTFLITEHKVNENGTSDKS